MGFNETLKLKVKRKAAFRCCMCERFGPSVDVHHIIPQEDGGPDTMENAVPLCPNCHGDYGGNPEKRKFITQKRDWWYEQCEKKYNNPLLSSEFLEPILDKIEKIDQKREQDTASLKSFLINILSPANGIPLYIQTANEQIINSMTSENASYITSAVINAATPVCNSNTDFTLNHEYIIDSKSFSKVNELPNKYSKNKSRKNRYHL